MERFMRFGALMRRYQFQRFAQRGPFGNPHRGQGRILSILKMKPEIGQKELGYLLDISKQALGELLYKLEQRGYITREQAEGDRRATIVKLTPEGAAAELSDADDSGIFAGLDTQEREKLAEYLDRINAELESLVGSRGPEAREHDGFGAHGPYPPFRGAFNRWRGE
jgi:DNA-binding MarR family transcriptional regulator